jgi:hypothetical protein
MVSNLTVIGSRRLAGLMVVAGTILGVMLVQAAGASAVSWELNGSPTTEAVNVASKGTLKFSDRHGGLFGEKLKIECAVTSEGSVGPGSTDATTHLTPTGCVTKEGTCPSPVVTALDLPWHTELAVVEGRTRDLLSSGGSGAPGYKSTCGGSAEDKCTGNTSTAIENVSGGVNTVFGAGSGMSCSRGGAGMGAIEGTELVENPAGGTLTAVEALAEAWQLNGSPLVTTREARSSGTLTFVNAHGGPMAESVEIRCTVNGEGIVGPEIAGNVSKLTATGCNTLAGSCSTPSITALNLPWQTELVPVAGAKRNLITSVYGPEYEVACAGGLFSYTCLWNASTAMSNVAEGVEATFADEKRTCNRGSGSTITGTQLIKEPLGGKLSI